MSEFTEVELIVFGDESKLVQGKIGYYNQEDWPVVVADINPHYECVRNPLDLAYKFAAAPDMLEALEMIEAMTELWLPNQVAEEHIEEAKALHKMRAAYLKAIAKAKGESQ